MSWRPDLAQTITQLEAALEQAEQQQEMNLRIANLAAAYDAQLYLLFSDLLRRLAAAPAGEAAASADWEAGQRRWLAERERRQGQAAAEYPGGTLASYSAGEAFIAATKERIAEVQAALARLPAAAAH